jgi:GTP-binding protein
MRIVDAQYVKSASRRPDWPAALGRHELAFCGRSNVGKSSLLNALLGRSGLARVSQTPGRTRLINFFAAKYIGQGGTRGELLCADLPGFGYAEVSRSERQIWRVMVEEYFTGRDCLSAVVLLCDGRRLLQGPERARELLFDELELAGYLRDLGHAVVPVITKSDKLSKNERKPCAALLARLLGHEPVICSAQTGEGQAELWKQVLRALKPEGAKDKAPAPRKTSPHAPQPGEDR